MEERNMEPGEREWSYSSNDEMVLIHDWYLEIKKVARSRIELLLPD